MLDSFSSSTSLSAHKGAPKEGTEKSSTRLLILVVERDPHVRELEAHFLKEAGFEVDFATDGQAAMEKVRQIRPHVVITEILVPKIDGLTLCRRLKSDEATRHISVLVFSILAASARATEAGADAFLMKPLAESRLVSTVTELINRRSDLVPQE
jgi:DNA-binding response OmpR family regulator